MGQPAFSPDGDRIAFTWDGGDLKNVDIYVKLIGAGSPLRLTTSPAQDTSPVWSPDGRYLAFIRHADGQNILMTVPALGGSERKVAVCAPTVDPFPLSWSPDGKYLAITDHAAENERFSIYLIAADDGEKRRLTTPPEATGDTAAAFSPDSKTVAFIRSAGFTSEDIYLTPTDGGEPRRLTADEQHIDNMTWTADGGELVFSSNRGGGFALWRVAVSGGEPQPVAGTGQNAFAPVISRQGDRLAYRVSTLDSEIWRSDINAGGRRAPATQLISSTRQDHSPQCSPDGKRMVFVSDRTGSEELWTAASDGSNPIELTSFNGPSLGTPRWSPDSQQIVFDARPNGNADIFIISADGGKPRPFITDASHDVMASWSHDAAWIYFCSNRSGDFQIWKAPVEGGPAVQLTQQGGFEAFESPGGDIVYYTKNRGPGPVWQVPVNGGEERQVSDQLVLSYWRYWAVRDDGIYFVSRPGPDRPAVALFSFSTRRVSNLAAIDRDPLQGLPGLTISPDGRSVLYSQADQSLSDIMLIENFR
jgi:Tol biopolymer transport system component